jgi:hypothetical protein
MKTKIIMTLSIFIFNLASMKLYAQDNYTIEIQALNSQIKISEPLLLNITYKYQNPKVSMDNEEIVKQLKLKDLYLKVTRKDETEETKYEIWPVTLFDTSGKGIEYSGWTMILWGELDRIFIFNEPGSFNCRVAPANDKVNSNTIEINVLPPTNQEKKAISIIKDYHDMRFIEFGGESTPEKISRLEKVVKECGNTMIAQMAAARLGIENTKNFENKYSENGSFIEQYRKGEIKDPLIDSAKKYLSIAYELPDGVPIRETAIYNLATFELFDGKTSKAFSIYDELAAKYPQGKYGKQAVRDKKDSQEFIDSHPDLFAQETKPSLETKPKPLGVVLPIAGAAAAGIVIAGLLIFLRKKNPKTSKIK